MLLPPADARRFIDTYQKVAVSIHALLQQPLPARTTQALSAAREQISEDPTLLERAVSKLSLEGVALDQNVTDSLGQLRLGQWVHLKDLKQGAILLDLKGREAYSVMGLTQPLASITGKSGMVIKTALCPFQGRILCDGVIVHVASLGREPRHSCNDRYRELKASGQLYTDPRKACYLLA